MSHGGVLNNLALIYHARGKYEKAVRPFLDDDRAIKADAERARKH